jgi:hypothetical protein
LLLSRATASSLNGFLLLMSNTLKVGISARASRPASVIETLEAGHKCDAGHNPIAGQGNARPIVLESHHLQVIGGELGQPREIPPTLRRDVQRNHPADWNSDIATGVGCGPPIRVEQPPALVEADFLTRIVFMHDQIADHAIARKMQNASPFRLGGGTRLWRSRRYTHRQGNATGQQKSDTHRGDVQLPLSVEP